MKHYVLGFVFNVSRTKVLLVLKEKPSWQAGYWNGIGGKIGDKLGSLSESPLAAMQREGTEEIGMRPNWEHCLTFVCSGGTVFVYRAFDTGSSKEHISYCQIEDEKLCDWEIDRLPIKVMQNLKWIIPILLSTCQFPIILHEDGISKETS